MMTMGNFKQKEQALLIGTNNRNGMDWDAEDSLEELSRLAETAGALVETTMIQDLKKVDASLFIGRGKVEEVRDYIASHDIDMVIFDDELTPTQQRNLEERFNTKTIDRTGLILDVFAQRAKSKEGKLQVELAQLTYTLTRIKGKGFVLSRLGGGIGTRGPGETQLEVDRRKNKGANHPIKKRDREGTEGQRIPPTGETVFFALKHGAHRLHKRREVHPLKPLVPHGRPG